MTRNQIDYLKLKEQQRANQAAETETHRANLERERQGVVSLDETSRHNLATEGFQAQNLDELIRSNQAREHETARHNSATEQQAIISYQEQVRSNQARERLQAEANSETRRANQAREQISQQQLAETERANRSNESLRAQEISYRGEEIGVRRSELEQRQLEAQLNEQFRRDQLAETVRYNTQYLDQGQQRLDETHRTNVANEVIRTAANVTNAGYLAEQVRHDLAAEAETSLHNRAMELKNYGTTVTYSGPKIENNTQIPQLPASSPVIIKEVVDSRGGGFKTGSRQSTTYEYGHDVMSDGSIRFWERNGNNGKKTYTDKPRGFGQAR